MNYFDETEFIIDYIENNIYDVNLSDITIIGHHERDFYKKKVINLGIYLKNDNNKMVGVAEIFDFDNTINVVTIGYTLNQNYWGRGLATKTTALLQY